MSSLNEKQLKDYDNNGFISPIGVLSLEEAKEIKKEIEYIEKKWDCTTTSDDGSSNKTNGGNVCDQGWMILGDVDEIPDRDIIRDNCVGVEKSSLVEGKMKWYFVWVVMSLSRLRNWGVVVTS